APQDRCVRKSYRDWSGAVAGSTGKACKQKRESSNQGSKKYCQKGQQQANYFCPVFVGHIFCKIFLCESNSTSPNTSRIMLKESLLLISRRFRVPAEAQHTDEYSA